MSTQTVVLSEATGSQIGYAPLTLTLNPSGYSVTDGPIVKIEYDFHDGTDSTIVKRRLSVESSEISAFAFTNDPGDPRNVKVTHGLFPSVSGDPQVFNLEISVTKATTFTPVVYNVPINVYKVDAINGLEQGFFGDIHLIGLRAHGDNNTKVMAFETADPRYVTFMTYNDDIANHGFIPTQTPTVTPTSTPTPTP